MRLLAAIWIAFATFAASAGDPASGPLRNRVDLNNAPKETIETLPGVGPKLADQIIAARPYTSVQQLEKVQGIGPKKFAQLRPHVYILPSNALPARVPSSPTNATARVNINTASQADLEKLPGIGPKRAEAIIKARPFNRPEDLKKIPGLKNARYEKLKDKVTVN